MSGRNRLYRLFGFLVPFAAVLICFIINGIAPFGENSILIGDAGQFPNRLSYEGLYYAFLTASHAAEAISTGRPFAEVNRKVFKNKKKEARAARFFYSPTGLALLRFLCK